jgi:hypothetical protein
MGKRLIIKYWPAVVSSIVLLMTVVTVFREVMIRCGGDFCYPLDDTWIHLAIAKHFAALGVWGVTPYAFSSSSSSMLWTLILSIAFKLFGNNATIPLILNVVISYILLFYVNRILAEYRVNAISIFLTQLAVIFFTPLVTVIFTGMEHILQTLITLIFVVYSMRALSDVEEYRKKDRDLRLLMLIAPFLVMIRYEGLFLLFIVCVLLMVRGYWKQSVFIGILGLLPVVIYGLISVSKGWFFLPVSVLLKGQLPEITSPGGFLKICFHWLIALVHTLHLLTLVSIGLVFLALRFGRKRPFWDKYHVIVILFILTTILHLQFAKTGWMDRYEAYLVCMGIVVSVICLKAFFSEIRLSMDGKIPVSVIVATLIFILLVAYPLARRGEISLLRVPRASKNIYEQQYQMGLFLKEYYEGAKVAANDIGAIDYLADIRVIDIWGLANIDIARARLDGSYGTEFVENLVRDEGAAIAIVYPHKENEERSGLPRDWMFAGQWTIPDNTICTCDTVQFYAIDPGEWDRLINNLRAFSGRLPADVAQAGPYLN